MKTFQIKFLNFFDLRCPFQTWGFPWCFFLIQSIIYHKEEIKIIDYCYCSYDINCNFDLSVILINIFDIFFFFGGGLWPYGITKCGFCISNARSLKKKNY